MWTNDKIIRSFNIAADKMLLLRKATTNEESLRQATLATIIRIAEWLISLDLALVNNLDEEDSVNLGLEVMIDNKQAIVAAAAQSFLYQVLKSGDFYPQDLALATSTATLLVLPCRRPLIKPIQKLLHASQNWDFDPRGSGEKVG